jgi:uncharacterized protein with PQ loop repeat
VAFGARYIPSATRKIVYPFLAPDTKIAVLGQGGKMASGPATPAAHSGSDAVLRRLLGGMSVFTMFMTIPQVLTIWAGHQAAGVSILSWSAYLVSAFLWLFFGIRKRDRNIYLPCIGWILLDGAVIAGAIVYG